MTPSWSHGHLRHQYHKHLVRNDDILYNHCRRTEEVYDNDEDWILILKKETKKQKHKQALRTPFF